MARASYVASARAMALSVSPLAWFCAAQWPDFTPPLTLVTSLDWTQKLRHEVLAPNPPAKGAANGARPRDTWAN